MLLSVYSYCGCVLRDKSQFERNWNRINFQVRLRSIHMIRDNSILVGGWATSLGINEEWLLTLVSAEFDLCGSSPVAWTCRYVVTPLNVIFRQTVIRKRTGYVMTDGQMDSTTVVVIGNVLRGCKRG